MPSPANPPTHPHQRNFSQEETEILVQAYMLKEGWEEARNSPVAQGQSLLGSRAEGTAQDGVDMGEGTEAPDT